MELYTFMKELETALVKRGVGNETAHKQVLNLRRTFTADDLSEIEAIRSNDEIEKLADSISRILNKNKQQSLQQKANAVAEQNSQSSHSEHSTVPQDAVIPSSIDASENISNSVQRQNDSKSYSSQKTSREAPVDDYFEKYTEPDATVKGIVIFWVAMFVLSPIWGALLVAVFGGLLGVILGLCGVIVAGVVLLIGVVALAAAISLVGIIFGITQLFSFLSAGIYEIGLGIMVAGAALFVSIIIYNIAIRLIPWFIGKIAQFMGFLWKKVKKLFGYLRKECYKL